MRLYLYAIAEGLELRRGRDGDTARNRLNVIPIGNALIVAGSVSELPEVSRDHLIAQDSVVRALHARADALLPMRFGSSVENIESLDAASRSVSDTGGGAPCALVRGREQMTVRVLRTRSRGAAGAAGAARCRGCWVLKVPGVPRGARGRGNTLPGGAGLQSNPAGSDVYSGRTQ